MLSSLDTDQLSRSQAEKASGLTPIQFRNAERDLRPAVESLSRRHPSTPTSSRTGSRPASAANTPTKIATADTGFDPNDRSPQALRAKAQAAQAGTLFSRPLSQERSPSAVSTPRTTRFQDRLAPPSLPHTPTKSSPLKGARAGAGAGAGADTGTGTPRASTTPRLSQAAAAMDTVESASHVEHVLLAKALQAEQDTEAVLDDDRPEHDRTVRLMAHVMFGQSDRKRRRDPHELKARLRAVRQRLGPLLESHSSSLESWQDGHASRCDLFVSLPLGDQHP